MRSPAVLIYIMWLKSNAYGCLRSTEIYEIYIPQMKLPKPPELAKCIDKFSILTVVSIHVVRMPANFAQQKNSQP